MPIIPTAVVDQIAATMSVKTLQHEVIAQNIANRDTQGYRRIKLRFDHAMDRAGAPRIVADDSAATAPLEQDVLALSANSGQYAALASVLSRYFSIIAAITNPNRG